MKKVRYELNQETKIDICRYINMNSGNADRPADQLRCSAVISQLPENCTWKMHPEPIFRDIDKHPGQTAPDVTSALCDVKSDKVLLLLYHTPPGIHSPWARQHTAVPHQVDC